MTEGSLLEKNTPEEFEKTLRKSIGLALIKPDSIELGVDEFLVEQITRKLKLDTKADLVGGVVIENLSEDDVGKIYPFLDEKYFRGYVSLLASSQEVLLIFQSSEMTTDLWDELKKIRGYINQGSGFEDSIRSAVPLPSQKAKFEETAKHLKDNELTKQDYRQMANNLLHTPDNIQEFSGLFSLIPLEELNEIFGKEKASILTERLSRFITPRTK